MSFAPFAWRPRWLQASGSLAIALLETVLTEPRPRVSFLLTAGPEVHLMALSNGVVQPRLAVQGGVQLSVLDGFGAKPCSGDARDCTQGLLDLSAIVTVLERVRLQLVWQTYPGLYAKVPGFFRFQLGVGFQFL